MFPACMYLVYERARSVINAAFTHAGLTIRYPTENYFRVVKVTRYTRYSL